MLTLEELLSQFEVWLRDDQDRSELTVKAYLADIQLFMTWYVPKVGATADLLQVTPTHIKNYRKYLTDDQHKKAASVNRRVAALRTFFKWAAMADHIGRSPVNGLKPLRQQVIAPRWLEPAAEEKLQQALEQRLQSVAMEESTPADQRGVRDVALTLLMWKAGLRVSEIVALDVSDVKIQSGQRGVVQVRLGKGRKSRAVPLNATAITGLKAWLKMRPAEGTALFLSRSNIRLTTRAVQQIIEQIGREAAALVRARSVEARAAIETLNALTPHVLRHTCAKRLLDAGAQLTEVAAILGHEDLNMTRRYTQPGEADLQRAVNRT
jgi:integrase/recombinase XerC